MGQGQVFNTAGDLSDDYSGSHSLWVRDRFLIGEHKGANHEKLVAIPLGEGQVFNKSAASSLTATNCRNPFGSGTGF